MGLARSAVGAGGRVNSAPSVVALVAVAGAVALLTPRSVSLGEGASTRRRSDAALLRRFRLPLSGLAGATGWAFVGGAMGLVAGAGAAFVAWRTLTNARSPTAIRRDQRLREDCPLVVELLAHALSAGSDIASALHIVGSAVGDPWESRLAICLNALRIGQAPAEVWAELEKDPLTSGLGRAFARSHQTGVPVSRAMRALAKDLREESDLTAHAYARTIEVRAAVPLGVCFLPAFVLLGVVPLVAGILQGFTWIS
ncbi:MAG TPA: type II secretion system F family protein [Marmoricola sp.]|nr:type II secretion system F family protein [Marmoricola sp.]